MKDNRHMHSLGRCSDSTFSNINVHSRVGYVCICGWRLVSYYLVQYIHYKHVCGQLISTAMYAQDSTYTLPNS